MKTVICVSNLLTTYNHGRFRALRGYIVHADHAIPGGKGQTMVIRRESQAGYLANAGGQIGLQRRQQGIAGDIPAVQGIQGIQTVISQQRSIIRDGDS